MSAYRISVALCTYNGAQFLPEQLDSIASQSRRPDELVVCDDGSTDQTEHLLCEFAKTAAFPVRVTVNVHNLGYSRNFAQAVGLCTGDLIALSDQDDRWHPEKLQQMEAMFGADPDAGGIFSDGDLMDMESQPLPGTLWGSFDFQREDRARIDSGDGIRVLLRRNVVTGMALTFQSRWRDTLQNMPEHWPHDFWLALMLAEKNALRACPERLVTYRVHGNQQIGVPITRAEKLAYLRAHGLSGYLKLSRERNLREYAKDALQFESLSRAASGAGPVLPGEGTDDPTGAAVPLARRWWMPLALEKAHHLRRGVLQLQSSRTRRWMSALYHWKSYRDYAPTGLSALIRDLLL